MPRASTRHSADGTFFAVTQRMRSGQKEMKKQRHIATLRESNKKMSTVRIEALNRDAAAPIPMQPASRDIWDKKYRLKTKQG
ncbi:MAG: hypothetical protein JSS33_03370, partial [Proteobacteria bacterium]|nr:hypothetical protein [Pseudomonadota bacterium]